MRSLLPSALTAIVLLGIPVPGHAQDLTQLFKKVSPTVVVIRAKGREITASGQSRFNETGSGVLISAEGKVMTAAHVVQITDTISVEFLGGESVSARIVASEPAADLSLLQLDRVPAGAAVAQLGNSDTVQVGQQIIIIGAPYGLSHSMSVGWISAKWPPDTVYKDMPLAEFFQTDATINQGNSGGPMFDMAGQVIGLVSHNISKSGGSEGLGFVVTINTAKELLLDKRSFWGGTEGQVLSNELADLLNLPPGTTGYLIKSVAKGSPAADVGLRGGTKYATIDGKPIVLGGDIILSIDDIQVKSAADLVKIRDRLAGLKPGTPLKAMVLREGRVLDLTGKVP
ncbi:MAG TPA: trypsin-like peptidase domain-containing protein [Candidatus Methylomirabilis sp.]|nr:trypsin-like peptidase domain-containing protein [Candidatus Methylomirabilis sp.]